MTSGHVNAGYVTDDDIENYLKKDQKSKKEEKPQKPLLWPQILGCVAGSLGHFAVGVVFGFTGVTLPGLTENNNEDFYLESHQVSIFSSIINIGSIFGSLISCSLMVWFGQRVTLLMFLPVGVAGWILMSQVNEYWLILLSRTILGLVIGICAGCCNNYVVEVAHSNIRGRMMALTDLCRQFGFFFVYVVGSSTLGWRIIGLICGIISLLWPFVMLIFLPNSPRWLANQGRFEEAKKSLEYFRGKDFNIEPEYQKIMEQSKSSNSKGVWDQIKLLFTRSIGMRMLFLSFLMYACHFTGNFAMITYSVSIFESTKSGFNEYTSTILCCVTRILGVIIYMVFADKLGRRPLLMVPLFFSGICMVSLGFYFYLQHTHGDVSHISWLPLVSLMFYLLFTLMTIPVMMLLRSELLPNSVRAVGVGILYFMFFVGTFSVSISYPYMVESIRSHWTFWVYSFVCFLIVIVVYLFIPETQGKSLEEIEHLFEKKKAEEEDSKA